MCHVLWKDQAAKMIFNGTWSFMLPILLALVRLLVVNIDQNCVTHTHARRHSRTQESFLNGNLPLPNIPTVADLPKEKQLTSVSDGVVVSFIRNNLFKLTKDWEVDI